MSAVFQTVLLLLWTLLAVLFRPLPWTVHGFYSSTSAPSRSRRSHQHRYLLSVRALRTNDVSADAADGKMESRKQDDTTATTMSPKLEAASIRRFTVGYDKLCKNCPTRLQPRVDTLTEMIMGLSTQDRTDLLAAVETRMQLLEQQQVDPDNNQRQEEVVVGLRTPMEVYRFQVGDVTEAKESINGNKKKKDKTISTKEEQEPEAKKTKIRKKMDKSGDKLKDATRKLERARVLLEVTSLFIREGTDVELPKELASIAVVDDDVGDAVKELRSMNRIGLKLQRFKYVEKVAKCERKRAKCRAERFAASIKLVQSP